MDLHDECFFPPPWNINLHPEMTEGWIEFQRYIKKNPEYYLSYYLTDHERRKEQ